ncbi:MAG: amidohydrolase family protein [candidate division NC10 bacterium]|nr:amidohydrolase family protein [candidate division NC10 bacterium]
MRLLTARWVFPVSAPPIADGAVAIQAGRIAGVGPRAELTAAWPSADRWELGEGALLPGLVNCHTHLELCHLSSPADTGNFATWLVTLIEGRRQLPLADQAAAAEAGARCLLESGTTSVGEVSTSGQSLAPLLRLGLRGVVYREILGLSPEEAETRCGAARADLQAMQRAARGARLRVGLSPHSPYSLSEALFGACGALLRGTSIPCCIHVAESAEEVEFLSTGQGAIPRRLYPAVGCAVAPPRRSAASPIEYLAALGALAWRPLLIHAVHVTATDIEHMARSGVSVAHCPRSNARLSGGVAPVPELLSEGIPVGLGTDSLASVPTLDLWDEMRAALEIHAGRLAPAEVLEMATLGGARALGLADQVGSLQVGKRADLIAVSAGAVSASDPVGSLIAGTEGADVLLTLVEGEIRHRRLEGVPCA